VPGGSVATEALWIGELKPIAIFHIAMKDATGKQIAVTGKAFRCRSRTSKSLQSKSGKKLDTGP
jgi:hypothetical protein